MDVFVDEKEIARQKEIASRLKASFKQRGENPKVFIQTYGCQQNEADSEKLRGIANLCGYENAAGEKDADLIIVNTCAIREHAELKTLSITGGYKKLKESNKDLLIMFCGCMAQQEHIRKKIYTSYPYIDAVFGTDSHHRLPEIILSSLKTTRRVSFVNDLPHEKFGVIDEGMPVTRLSPYRALLSVMYGCDNYCTYCVVPYVRGRERSRDSRTIIDEAKGLVESGYRDITLLGQNVNSYSGSLTFPELLRELSKINGDFWLRFMTSNPKDASKKLIDVMAGSEKIANHFHLPVQSGNDEILKRMNRRYTRAEYLKIVDYIRKKLPSAAITTDIICGFPGETEKQFEDTLSLVREVGFDMIYTFIFSPRKGTAAGKMENQVPKEEKSSRFSLLSGIQNEISLKINRSYVGKTLRVLSDGNTGRTSRNKIVNLSSALPAGEFRNVKITGARPYSLDGDGEI
ncbi:MAG: tRNA (N6-isopentenyl adenosine(37)-C2)-methylthiotransferase MiaB [Eubacteriales bacterium]